MEYITLFVEQYGWELAFIAFIGVVLLGVLKYSNAFESVEKEKRKPIYFAISIGFSVIATIIYLVIKGQCEINYIITISLAIYALNQAMYAIYETTTLRDLLSKILTALSTKVKHK